MKRCSACKLDRLEKDFGKSKNSKDGLHHHCLECTRDRFRRRRQIEKDRSQLFRTCSIDGCERMHAAKGWCLFHYNRNRKNGSPYITKYERHGFSKGSSGINGGRKEYQIWYGIKSRCHNPNVKGYYLYGGRGIKMCDEWLKSFKSFYDHVGARPSRLHSIDRIDNDGNYEPGNVRWATKAEQAKNRRPRNTASPA